MSSEWETCRTISELIATHGGSIKTGPFGTTLKASEYAAEGVPLISVREIGHGSFHVEKKTPRIGPATLARLPEYILEEGDIVFARKGGIERCALIRKPQAGWFLGSDGIRLRPPAACDARYLAYVLQTHSIKEWLLQNSTGSTMASLNGSIIGRLPISLPGLSEQKSVADFLELLDDRINLLRETNATIEAIAQALFKSWFVDFDPVRAKMEGRAPEGMDEATAALFPDSFEETELGAVPRGWRIGELGDVLTLRNKRAQPSDITKALPYVPIESIGAKTPFLTESKSGEEANSSLILFEEGDILFGAMRPYFHKVCIAPFDGVTRTTVFTLKSRNPRAKEFGLFLVYQNSTIEYATQHSEGSTIPYAKWKNSLERMPVLLPSNCLQNVFSETVEAAIARANSNNKQAQTLAALRHTLLPRLISGKLRLPEAEALVA